MSSILPDGSDSKTPHSPETDDDQFWTVTVEIPRAATDAEVHRIFDAVADAAFDNQPGERNWDIFVHGRGPRPDGFPAGGAR